MQETLTCNTGSYVYNKYLAKNYVSEKNVEIVNRGGNTGSYVPGNEMKKALLQFDFSNAAFKTRTIKNAKVELYMVTNFAGSTYIWTDIAGIIRKEEHWSNCSLVAKTYNTNRKLASVITWNNQEDIGKIGSKIGEFHYINGDYTEDTFDKDFKGIIQLNLKDFIIQNRENDICSIWLYADQGSGVNMVIEKAKAKIIIEYENAQPTKPVVTEPKQLILKKDEQIKVKWRYIPYCGDEQKKYEIGFRQEDGDWQNTIKTTGESEHVFQANAFKNGNVECRVKVWNADLPSDYTYFSFVVIGAPQVPRIRNVENDAKPEFVWDSTEQDVFQLRIKNYSGAILYETGTMPGYDVTSMVSGVFLKNGNYSLFVRIKNEYDIWSNWSVKDFTINCTIPEKPDISVMELNTGLMIKTHSNAIKNYLYREDEEGSKFVGEIKERYIDYTVRADKTYYYCIRAYEKGFIDSEKKAGKIKFDGILLADVGNKKEHIRLMYTTTPYKIKEKASLKKTKELIYYTGRTYPVKETGEFTEETLEIEAFVRKEELEVIKKMVRENKTIFLRDNIRNHACDMEITSIENEETGSGYNIGLKFTRTDR